MKNKKMALIFALALVISCLAGCSVSNTNSDASSNAGTQVSQSVEESADTEKSDKGKIAFVGIDAVAAQVLGVTEESLADTNHAEELYALLEDAGKVEEFKKAVIQAKTEQYDSARGNTTYTDEELDEKLEGYITVINEWDGTTELVVTSGGK